MKNEILAKWYYNNFISKKSGDGIDRISMALFNSKIKLTPHQIDASLFAFKSPINKGVLLADEVGLGKTIEAGIIIAQLWYERKAKVLIICPASLIRQWNNELYDKFLLESEIMDRKQYNSYLKKGYSNPFKSCKSIVICSYQFASINSDMIKLSDFDTVIIDEAHKLRNAYTEKSIIGTNIKNATANMQKILLSATPIQNSMMDLYGLASFIDENIFGDKDIFRLNYIKKLSENMDDLKNRLNMFMHRTLRNQVSQYIRYTNRIAKTFTFSQTEEEKIIYNELQQIILNSDENPYIIPKGQSHLLLLILCKLMGSSIYALNGTLSVILNRLNNLKQGLPDENYILSLSEETFEELEDFETADILENMNNEEIDAIELDREIKIINDLIEKIGSIKKESKYYTLLESLKYSFQHLKEIGANEKVLIFTESTRTQEFLYNSLIEDGYDNVLLFNGSNNSKESSSIYNEWINRPENSDKKNYDKAMNMRAAIIDKFSKDGKILISTETGAEGLNLQFCSLIINYDLPWNPQRVEQRIGRCHRFGQKFDVNVINFINNSNKAEQRIYELLSTKFNLFDSVFGASDEILGMLDDNNIELSIAGIYKKCRTEDEIDDAFNLIQQKYSTEITENIAETKLKIIENLEDFKGKYKISSRNEDGMFIDYNSNTKLGKYVLEKAAQIDRKFDTLKFNISDYPYKISEIEKMKGEKGMISFNKFTISSFDKEEYIFLCGKTENGNYLDNEVLQKMFRVESTSLNENNIDRALLNSIETNVKLNCDKIFNESTEKNNDYLNQEITKINNWAEDKIQAIEFSVENMREQRKELRKQSDLCTNSNDKIFIEEQISKLTKKISSSWMELSDAEEIVEEKRNNMICSMRKESMKSSNLENIFTINYEVI